MRSKRRTKDLRKALILFLRELTISLSRRKREVVRKYRFNLYKDRGRGIYW